MMKYNIYLLFINMSIK